MSQSQNQPALLPCQIAEWILTMTMTKQRPPESREGVKEADGQKNDCLFKRILRDDAATVIMIWVSESEQPWCHWALLTWATWGRDNWLLDTFSFSWEYPLQGQAQRYRAYLLENMVWNPWTLTWTVCRLKSCFTITSMMNRKSQISSSTLLWRPIGLNSRKIANHKRNCFESPRRQFQIAEPHFLW